MSMINLTIANQKETKECELTENFQLMYTKNLTGIIVNSRPAA